MAIIWPTARQPFPRVTASVRQSGGAQLMNRLRPSFLAATALAILWAGACVAHAYLQSSMPAANAQLAQAPSTLTLNFSEKAQLAVLRVTHAGNPVAVPIDRTLAPEISITV